MTATAYSSKIALVADDDHALILDPVGLDLTDRVIRRLGLAYPKTIVPQAGPLELTASVCADLAERLASDDIDRAAYALSDDDDSQETIDVAATQLHKLSVFVSFAAQNGGLTIMDADLL
jgi:hypothetical protein